MSSAITVRGLFKSFDDTKVLDDFSIDFEQGKITAIFGPNASGKSTLLNILSGVIQADKGNFRIKDSNRFQISYIFQNYRDSLLPWRTNFQNIALPLEIQGKSGREIRHRVEELQALFEFDFDWNGYPYQLSGGQQQILAFIRALVSHPKVLFVDEPFSALDYENNLRLRDHVQRYYLAYKPTILLVTHNIEEAVHLASEIVVLSQKPVKTLKRINNPLRYPRTVRTLTSEHFHKVKDQVLSTFVRAANL